MIHAYLSFNIVSIKNNLVKGISVNKDVNDFQVTRTNSVLGIWTLPIAIF
jgi:hypothetical protein